MLMLSLGVDCRVAYQISLHQYLRANPGNSKSKFTQAFKDGDKSARPQGGYFFDWIVTPTPALIKILHCRFEGIFELRNLALNQHGSVVDDTFGIVYQHLFSRDKGKVTTEIIKQEYENRKSKIGYLITKTVKAINKQQEIVFIIAGISEGNAIIVSEALNDLGCSNFKIVAVKGAEHRAGWSHHGQNVSFFTISKVVNKPPALQWQGDDEEWSVLLEDIEGRYARI